MQIQYLYRKPIKTLSVEAILVARLPHYAIDADWFGDSVARATCDWKTFELPMAERRGITGLSRSIESTEPRSELDG